MSDPVFDRIDATVLNGHVQVRWRLSADFLETSPHTFQLQRAESPTADEADWADIGTPVVDENSAVDTDPLEDGPVSRAAYRLQLETADGSYVSQPVTLWGGLRRHEWLLVQAQLRRHRLQCVSLSGSVGWLLARRRHSAPVEDTDVVDSLTGEVRTSVDTVGYGTGLLGGYMSPTVCRMIVLPGSRANKHDEERGQVVDEAVTAIVESNLMVDVGDVWVDARSGVRYSVLEHTTQSAVAGHPVISRLSLGRMSPSEPVYAIPVPDLPLDTPYREEWM